MNLKEQLKTTVKSTTEREKKEQREEERRRKENLVRSPKDWLIVEDYIDELLKRYAKNKYSIVTLGILKKRYIVIPDCKDLLQLPYDGKRLIQVSNPFKLTWEDMQRLRVNYEDMQKFCKQHKLKLKYMHHNKFPLSQNPLLTGWFYLIGM